MKNKEANDCSDCATTIIYERECSNEKGCRNFDGVVIANGAKEEYTHPCANTAKCAGLSCIYITFNKSVRSLDKKNIRKMKIILLFVYTKTTALFNVNKSIKLKKQEAKVEIEEIIWFENTACLKTQLKFVV